MNSFSKLQVIALHEEWHFQHAWDLGLFSRSPLPLPPWDRQGEDPLEAGRGDGPDRLELGLREVHKEVLQVGGV